ncbi:MAG: hypothetical protein JWQ55_4928 [Rhodopila sp.]|jgi:hypothetical protein|nr:hypothetical protein [Rhodopila sp.]
MKKMILAALVVIGAGAGAANAQSLSHSAPPHQQTGSQND